MTGSFLLFAFLAVVAVAAAVGMLVSRSSVYSAIFLIANFSTVAVIYLTLGAPFIALAQITVYAGAIMVLFLFVIMLLGAEKISIGGGQVPRWQQGLGLVLGLLVMGEAAYLIVVRSGMNAPLAVPSGDFASPSAIGLSLFNQYMLPFEITSVLLLVAVVGAIVLTKPEKKEKPRAAAALDGPVEATQADLMQYERQVEADEMRGNAAGPGGEDIRQKL
jgi:NADH-quinone oxidoreductase subunit J